MHLALRPHLVHKHRNTFQLSPVKFVNMNLSLRLQCYHKL
jgi:hypothetical protein